MAKSASWCYFCSLFYHAQQYRNKFLIYGIIQPTIDPKFCEFTVCNENLKKLVFVCHRISEKDFESIEDSKYVVENFLHQLVTNSSQFSSRQREQLKSVKEEDFMDAYIHRVINELLTDEYFSETERLIFKDLH